MQVKATRLWCARERSRSQKRKVTQCNDSASLQMEHFLERHRYLLRNTLYSIYNLGVCDSVEFDLLMASCACVLFGAGAGLGR